MTGEGSRLGPNVPMQFSLDPSNSGVFKNFILQTFGSLQSRQSHQVNIAPRCSLLRWMGLTLYHSPFPAVEPQPFALLLTVASFNARYSAGGARNVSRHTTLPRSTHKFQAPWAVFLGLLSMPRALSAMLLVSCSLLHAVWTALRRLLSTSCAH